MHVSRPLIAATMTIGVIAGCGSPGATPPAPTATPRMASGTVSMAADSHIRIAYGKEPQQFADLSLPTDLERSAPVVVLIHGGFWRTPYDLTLMEPLAADLVVRGYAVWNLEYRRIGDDGGAWPGTLVDVATGIDALADVAVTHALDLDRVAFVGHSAGGHLALWSAGRSALPAEAPGSRPAVTPMVAIGQGAVVDLVTGSQTGLGNGAVVELLGGSSSEFPDRYEWATPAFGAGPELVSVVGTLDDIVPPSFSDDPTQPGEIEVVAIDGADHFAHIDVSSSAWQAVVDRLDATIGR